MGVTTHTFSDLISDRARAIDASGIRRIFELGANLKDPVNLSIGQPDFPVPDEIKDAAIAAIRSDRNGYTVTQGRTDLLARIAAHLNAEVGWTMPSAELEALVTSGTSGALLLAFMVLLNPGDEAIIPDPYFVIYPNLATMVGATPILCDTYPDFRMTADRIAPLITDRTKVVLLNSPANPTGVVLSSRELRDVVDLCHARGIVLISDEIYDAFTYSESLEDGRSPTPAAHSQSVLLVRGFGKTYGCTGWRMGYAAGPREIIGQMAKLQQFSFVCAPSMAQAGCIEAFDIDLTRTVEQYEQRRDLVLQKLSPSAAITRPGGAFYAFVEVPEALGVSGAEFVEQAIEQSVLVIPGGVFSSRDTHFRVSFAASEERLVRGLDTLAGMMNGNV